MPDIRRFENDTLFAIKAVDYSVRTRQKVAVLGAFTSVGSVRPGFKVNFMSTEGVGGTSQVIRFEDRETAQRWINQKARMIYNYALEDVSIMSNRSGEYVRLPLADFDEDIWVNSIIIGRLKNRTKEMIMQYCPEYLDSDTFERRQLARVELPNEGSYRGFSF